MIRRVLGLTLLLLGVLSLPIAWRLLDRPIATIVVTGEVTEAERNQIRDALGQTSLQGILSTNLTQLHERLQSMGWPRNVDLRRRWPNKIVVSVTKVRPVARWGEGSYLAADGSELALPDDYPNLPHLNSGISSPQQTMEVFRLLQQLAERQDLRIVYLAESARGEWRLQFASGMRLQLGAERITERMHRFLRSHQQTLGHRVAAIDYVDARYTSGIAVRFFTDQETSEPLAAPLNRLELAARLNPEQPNEPEI